MSDDKKAILRIAALLAVGLSPGLAALLIAPSRGAAIAAAGSATMGIAFVMWTQRLVADAHHLKQRESALRGELAALEETAATQARELRDARTHDAATGVLNRPAFLRRLDETISREGRSGKSVAFLLVDVEGFKAINIERGRAGGDATLKRVGRALEDATRGTDYVGRLTGDEFGVVLNDCNDPGPAVDRIFRALRNESGKDGAPAVHVAIGAVAIENPAGVELQELFQLAESALASVRGKGDSQCARRTLGAAAAAAAVSS